MTTGTLNPAVATDAEAQETSGRLRTALWCTGTAAAIGGAATGLIARDLANADPFAMLLAAGAGLLATAIFVLLAYITASTRSAVAHLIRQIGVTIRKALADVVDQLVIRLCDRLEPLIKRHIQGAVTEHVAQPLGQTVAEVARIRAIARGTALNPTDDTLPLGLRLPAPRGKAYASVALADGQIRSMVDRHVDIVLAGVRSEVAEITGHLVGLPALIAERCAEARREGRADGAAETAQIFKKIMEASASPDRMTYWAIYTDVMNDLGGIRPEED
ncbi:hypothetical protein K1W54_28855 [Micromonospora sp. CPCC 205371]|nr:hypothetical protein [Micromonospora sp. CPCC 205371]